MVCPLTGDSGSDLVVVRLCVEIVSCIRGVRTLTVLKTVHAETSSKHGSRARFKSKMSGSRTKTAKAKAVFYRLRNDLHSLLESGESSRTHVRSEFSKLSLVFEDLLDNFRELGEKYAVYEEVEKIAKLDVELEKTETDFTETEEITNRLLAQIRGAAKQDVSKVQFNRPVPSQQELDSQIRKQEEEIEQITKDIQATMLEIQYRNDPAIETSKSEAVATSDATPREDVNETETEAGKKCQDETSNLANAQPVAAIAACHLPSTVESDSVVHVLQNTPVGKSPALSQDNRNAIVQELPNPSFRQVLTSTPYVLPPQAAKKAVQSKKPELQAENDGKTKLCLGKSYQSFNDSSTFDPARLLTRVSIPKFSGEKKNYESWKAAFVSCVDKTTSSAEYKLLRLRNCLEGEALKVIESLGHSEAAYEVTKERLDRKYGGKRRQIAMRMEEVNKFKQVREGNARDLEAFAELLDVLIVNLIDAGQQSELGGGALYMSLQRKLNETLLTRYNRWIYEKYLPETVENLRVFINQESEFLTSATETVRGMAKEVTRRDQHTKAFVTQVPTTNTNDRYNKCQLCGEAHCLWACQKFKALSHDQRWEKAKSLHVCFRCLSSSHEGRNCPRSRVCGISGCDRTHHNLLHSGPEMFTKPQPERSTRLAEGTARSHTSTTSQFELDPVYVALRTVPIVLRNEAKSIRVNALLDDASTKSYINSDIAAELGLEGEPVTLKVNVLNDCETELCNSTLVEFQIESVDGKTTRPAMAHTTNRVTGNMSVVNWNRKKDRWQHLHGLKFPQVGKRPIVDVLIGVDQADLHCSLQEVMGEPGEPIARLTPLGWTCIGYPNMDSTHPRTNVTFTQHLNTELNELVRRFWEIEEPLPTALVRPDEKYATEIASKSLRYSDGRYCVGIPWKKEMPELPNNYNMALHRLQNTEKRLLKDQQVGESYRDVIKSYLEKGYIHKVTESEDKAVKKWYLPHFPVLKPDKSTTKTRIVFDASAKLDGVSLNDAIHQGPKLQNELFAVLLRFRNNPIAIMCDIAEMYLQINMKPEDRPLHRFLWRDLNQSKPPDVYEFGRIVFGVNSSPFLAQFVSQQNAINNQSQYPLAADTVINSTYMDDSMDSVKDVATAIKLREELVELWGAAGMHARKWLSNAPDVLKSGGL